jgi:hypothetical protein
MHAMLTNIDVLFIGDRSLETRYIIPLLRAFCLPLPPQFTLSPVLLGLGLGLMFNLRARVKLGVKFRVRVQNSLFTKNTSGSPPF